jgi:hypothetical protein
VRFPRALVVAFVSALLIIAGPPAALSAQSERPRLEISLGAVPGQEDPSILTSGLLADPHTRDLLVNGAFPERMHFKLELWRKGGVFDDLDGRTEWDMLVSYDPTRQIFNVVRQLENQFEDFGGFSSIAAADGQIARPFRVPLRASQSGHYYYNLTVEVRTLTETDLVALQQFVRGTPQATSKPLSWLGRSLGKLLSRVLGGDTRRYAQQSGVFGVP